MDVITIIQIRIEFFIIAIISFDVILDLCMLCSSNWSSPIKIYQTVR